MSPKELFDQKILNVNLMDNYEENRDELMEQFIDMRLDLCDKCQENRVVCILRPKCKDRRFLDVLIGLQVDKNKLPHFCYSQRLKEYNQAKARGREPISDAWILAEDLGKTFKSKAPKLKKGKKNIERVLNPIDSKAKYTHVDKDSYIFLIKDDLFLANLKSNTAIINLKKWKIPNETVLTSLLELLLSDFEKIKIDVRTEPGGFFSFTLTFVDISLNKTRTDMLIRKSDFLFGFDEKTIIGEISSNKAEVNDIFKIYNTIKTILKTEQDEQ